MLKLISGQYTISTCIQLFKEILYYPKKRKFYIRHFLATQTHVLFVYNHNHLKNNTVKAGIQEFNFGFFKFQPSRNEKVKY
jgi:hypothetical protein